MAALDRPREEMRAIARIVSRVTKCQAFGSGTSRCSAAQEPAVRG